MNNVCRRKHHCFLLLILFLLLGILAAYSSSKPDGLTRILQIFALDKAVIADQNVLFADYIISPGFPEILNQFLSALVGMGIIMFLIYLIYKISAIRSQRDRIDNAT